MNSDVFRFVVLMSHTRTCICKHIKAELPNLYISVMYIFILQSYFATFPIRSGHELNWGQVVGKYIPPFPHDSIGLLFL